MLRDRSFSPGSVVIVQNGPCFNEFTASLDVLRVVSLAHELQT